MPVVYTAVTLTLAALPCPVSCSGLQSNGCMSAGASVDGIIVRDLQLPETARHAYVLRPLPARARRLNAWHAVIRRALLGIQPISPGRRL